MEESTTKSNRVHWTKISQDPNLQKLIDWRRGNVKAAQKPPVADRLEYLKSLAKGKNVLDVGVIDHQIGQHHSADWLHGALKSVANKILGVDILQSAIDDLRKEGFNVRLADITKNPLEEKFDVIIVGEVIEHLNNPGSLFESAAKMLNPGGRLVLTTPNPYFLGRVWDAIKNGFNYDSVDHVTLLFPFGIAEMAERAGLKLDSWRGIKVSPPKSLLSRLKILLVRIMPISKESLCHAIIYECTLE